MVGCYCRVSTQEQAVNGHSINEQIERTNKYCEAVGWKVYKTYTDAGYSGSNTDRPALQMLIQDAKKGVIDKVLVYKLDRLSRSQKDTLTLIEDVFLASGCDFVSMSENFDTSSPFGRAMIGILAVFAQLEREQIKERMTMGRQARVKGGKYNGSYIPPVGYAFTNGELVTEPYEKMQVIRIYNEYLSGNSFAGIAKKFNNEGFLLKGRLWNYQTVRHILMNRLYIGEVSYKQVWYKGTHEPFISVETFDKVQRIIAERRDAFNHQNRRSGKDTSYLAGLIRCGKCGHKYAKKTQKSGNKTYYYYACNYRGNIKTGEKACKNTYIPMRKLDNIVFDEIKKLRFEPIEIKTENNDVEIELIKKQIDTLNAQIEKLIDLYTVGNIPVDNLQSRITALTDEKEHLTGTLADLEQNQKSKMPESEIIDLSQKLSDLLPSSVDCCAFDTSDLGVSKDDCFSQIKAIVDALIETIEIDGESIKIHWKFN